MYKGYTTLASSGEYDNRPVISEILKLRARKAALLGFKDFASYSTSKVMAKTPENAENLLMQIWAPAVKKVNEEVAELQALATLRTKFTEMPDAPKYYPEVTVYDVTDAKSGEHIAVFMTDYFPRESKRQGAWMSEFKGSWTEADGTSSRPII